MLCDNEMHSYIHNVCMKLNPGSIKLQKPVCKYKISFFTLEIQI